MAFLHKELNESERAQIKQDVKQIVDNFGAVLGSLGDLPMEGFIERRESFREETLEFPCDKTMKEKILENAPHKNKDCIIAEKKAW